MNGCKRGFTLIELLIVVAIIAILAAIAVPNFLEAQTRSKVSRVKADQRTLAIGLESYRVDSNGALPGFSGNYWYANRYPLIPGLTSPVAYLTSVPEDQFLKQFFYNTYTPAVAKSLDWSPAVWDNNIIKALKSGGSAPGLVGKPTGVDVGLLDIYVVAAFRDNGHENASFMIRGWGPHWQTQSYVTAYDPTNGTVSAGHIYHFQ